MRTGLGSWAIAVIVLCTVVLAASPAALANVLPETGLVVHVRAPGSPGDCSIPGVDDCSDLTRSTTNEGELEFDLFVAPFVYLGEEMPIRNLATDIVWPPAWELLGWEPCNGGSGTLQDLGNRYRLDLEYSVCPSMGNLFLAARFFLRVQGYGRFFPGDNSVLRVQCPQSFESFTWGYFGEAGVVCDRSVQTCASADWCAPQFEQAEVSLSAGPGGSLSAEVPFTAIHSAGFECPFFLQCDEPWLTAGITAVNNQQYILNLTADAVGLPAGSYETWVRVDAFYPDANTRRCVRVTMEIPATSGVEAPDDEHFISTSWGRIKADSR